MIMSVNMLLQGNKDTQLYDPINQPLLNFLKHVSFLKELHKYLKVFLYKQERTISYLVNKIPLFTNVIYV